MFTVLITKYKIIIILKKAVGIFCRDCGYTHTKGDGSVGGGLEGHYPPLPHDLLLGDHRGSHVHYAD